AELAQRGQRVLGLLAVEQGVLALQRAERMHAVRAPHGVGRGLGEAEEADLARLHAALHAAHGLLDRHLGIDAVLVVEVDDVHAEPLEAGVARLHDVLRAAVDHVGAARVLHLAELGDEDHAVTPALERLAEQLLVVAPAVHVGRVDVIDAEVDGALDERDRLAVVGGPVHPRQPHAPQSDRRHVERAVPEPPLLHHRREPSLKGSSYQTTEATAYERANTWRMAALRVSSVTGLLTTASTDGGR